LPERLIIVVEISAWDILKNVQNDGYTPENRRNLRKSQEFQEIDSTPGNIFRYEDEIGVFLVKEYPEREEIRVEMEDDGSPDLVPEDYMDSDPVKIEGSPGGGGTRVALYYEGEEEAVEEVQRLLEEDDRYDSPGGREVLKYRRGDAVINVKASRGAMSVVARDLSHSDSLGVPPSVWKDIELVEISILSTETSDAGKSYITGEGDSALDLEDWR
ncbi:MAG: hypothetical protein ABEJ62_02730, partial [Candidatus Nanohaloarchaea archaeon]